MAQQALVPKERGASQAKAEDEAPISSACLAGDLKVGSYKNPHLYGHNEEGILCAEHPKGYAASICCGDISRWASFSTR